MTDTQAAATDAGQSVAKPTPDAPREPSLKDLLAEYDKQHPTKNEQPKPAARATPQSAEPANPAPQQDDDDDVSVKEWVKEQRAKEMRQSTQTAVTDAVKYLRDGSDALADVPDRFLRGMLHDEASNNPDFARAFIARHQSPAIWQAALKELVKAAEADFSQKPDQQLTANREAARASVRGTTQTRPDPDDAKREEERRVSQMSRAEFKEAKKQLIQATRR